jgi:hypothetical protein
MPEFLQGMLVVLVPSALILAWLVLRAPLESELDQ